MSLSYFATSAIADTPVGKDLHIRPVWLPATTISGVEILDPKEFGDIYKIFLDPILRSDFCQVIDHIIIDTSCREAAQWKVDLYLETGEHIALHKLGAFYSTTNYERPYERATKSVFQQLEAILKTNPKLRKLFREYFPKHRNA